MVLVTSSIADEVCRLIFADSSDAPATWVEALATIQADVQATSAAHAAWKVAQTVGVGAEFVAAERVR